MLQYLMKTNIVLPEEKAKVLKENGYVGKDSNIWYKTRTFK